MYSIQIFPWSENFETGLPQIDEQHHRLVELLNRLAGHLAYQSDIPVLDSIFNELTEYASYHFASEEEIWGRYLPEDPWEVEHRRVHGDFIAEVQRLRAEESYKPMEEVVEDILTFLCQWLAIHILESDKRMALAVLAVQAGCTPDEARLAAEKGMNGAVKLLVKAVLSMYESLSSRTLALMKEIAKREKVEAKLRLAANVFDNTSEAICITDAKGAIIEANPAFCQITEQDYRAVLGQSLVALKSGLKDDKMAAPIWQCVNDSDHWGGEISNRAPSGEIYAEWLSLSAVRDEAGEVFNYVAVFSSVGQLIQRQKTMEHIANHDPLTGLPNRLLLFDRLEQGMATAEREDKLMAVCYLDLDGFKPINDSCGHAAGDQVLREVARRLKSLLRNNDTVARLGGDEFVIVNNGLSGADSVPVFLERVLGELQQPIEVEGTVVAVSASIGISLFPCDGGRAEALLRNADEALYQAKAAGKSCFRFYRSANCAS